MNVCYLICFKDFNRFIASFIIGIRLDFHMIFFRCIQNRKVFTKYINFEWYFRASFIKKQLRYENSFRI